MLPRESGSCIPTKYPTVGIEQSPILWTSHFQFDISLSLASDKCVPSTLTIIYTGISLGLAHLFQFNLCQTGMIQSEQSVWTDVIGIGNMTFNRVRPCQLQQLWNPASQILSGNSLLHRWNPTCYTAPETTACDGEHAPNFGFAKFTNDHSLLVWVANVNSNLSVSCRLRSGKTLC